MKLARVVVLMLAAAGLVPRLAFGAAKSDGLEATVTDTFDFKMRLNGLVFKVKPQAGTGSEAARLDHIPLVSDGKAVNLWLVQIGTAEFSGKEKGGIEVKAVLQGEKDEVKGSLEKAGQYFFEGLIAEGDRKGRSARFPLAEVKALQVHTKYEGTAGTGNPSEMLPMPAANRDVLWVVSVPPGAEVYAKPFDCKAAEVWKEYVRIGTTPFVCELGPGQYAVQVLVPAKLAATIRPSMKLGDDANLFEKDGWGEAVLNKDANILTAVTYTVMKREGQAATLISLFQKKGQTLDQVIEGFPRGHNFNFNDKEMEKDLLYQQVPPAEVAKILDALHRGGKIIWHGADKSLMIELTPGERGWKIGGADRPKKK